METLLAGKNTLSRGETGEEHQHKILQSLTAEIALFPRILKMEMKSFEGKRSHYKNNGTVSLTRLVSRCSDWLVNSYLNLKLILAEEEPVIRPPVNDKWTGPDDNQEVSAESSLKLVELLTHRIVSLLNKTVPEDLKRKYFDPSDNRTYTMEEFLSGYPVNFSRHLAMIIALKRNIYGELK